MFCGGTVEPDSVSLTRTTLTGCKTLVPWTELDGSLLIDGCTKEGIGLDICSSSCDNGLLYILVYGGNDGGDDGTDEGKPEVIIDDNSLSWEALAEATALFASSSSA